MLVACNPKLRSACYLEVPEMWNHLTEALAILGVVHDWSAQGRRKDLLCTVCRSVGHDLIHVPCVVSIDDGLGRCFLGGEGGHYGCFRWSKMENVDRYCCNGELRYGT